MTNIEQSVIERIGKKRSEMVASMRDNNAWDGFKRTLADLYPDEGHFIYELLQNAEDAQATTVHFRLDQNMLVVTHDGKRLFREQDVESITNIGNSTKRDDVNTIGKFGVGFKAVFAYTTTPCISSGGYHFEINDLFVPIWRGDLAAESGKTVFRFKFNADKSAKRCHDEIEAWLRSVSDNVLLFLKHINRLEWTVDASAPGYLERMEFSNEVVALTRKSLTQANAETSYWLRFLAPLPEVAGHFVAIAFHLTRKKGVVEYDIQKPVGDQFEITDTRNGQVSIYFPAEKESSRLRFHIHGPYAAPIDRASVKHTDENSEILEITSELLGDSLPRIRDLGLLTTEFLGILPNEADELDEFYEPLRYVCIERMRAEDLVPVLGGGFAPATRLLIGPARIRDVVDSTKLEFYTGFKGHNWVAGVMQGDRTDKFLKSLKIQAWGWEELLDRTHQIFNRSKATQSSDAWIIAQGLDWGQAFYALLNEMLERVQSTKFLFESGIYQSRMACGYWRIVQTATAEVSCGGQVFFPGNNSTAIDLHYPTVAPDIFTGTRNQQITAARGFLAAAGVRHFGEGEAIELLLQKHYTEKAEFPPFEDNVKHLRIFIRWWKATSETKYFTDKYIVLSEPVDGKHFKLMPSQCMIDAPFMNTGMYDIVKKKIYSVTGKNQLFTKYAEEDLLGLPELLCAFKALDYLRPSPASIHANPDRSRLLKDASATKSSPYAINEDYAFVGLDWGKADLSLSRAIWLSMSVAETKILQARYRPNLRFEIRTSHSQAIHDLRTHAWVPTKEGKFKVPCEVQKEELPDGFPIDDRNGWQTAIGLGAGRVVPAEQQKAIQGVAKTLGMNGELLQQAASLSAEERKELEAVMSEAMDKMLARKRPKPATASPEQRTDGMLKGSAPRNQDLSGKGVHGSDTYGATSATPAEKLYSELADDASSGPAATQMPPLRPEKALQDAFNRKGREQLQDSIPQPGLIRDPKGYRERTRQKYRTKRVNEPLEQERTRKATVRIWETKNTEVRDFFLAEYGGKCQICDFTFPRRSDGKPYFEGVYLIPHSEAAWTDAPGSVLCLCAQCSAQFQHGSLQCEDVLDQITSLKTESESGTQPALKFTLAGNQVKAKLSDRHLVEIQELLGAFRSMDTVAQTSTVDTTERPENSNPGLRSLVQCPQCTSKVRSDRLQSHIANVHTKVVVQRVKSPAKTSGYLDWSDRGGNSSVRTNVCRYCSKPVVPGTDTCYSHG